MRKLLTTIAIAAGLICSLVFANRSSEAAHTKATFRSVPTIEAGVARFGKEVFGRGCSRIKADRKNRKY